MFSKGQEITKYTSSNGTVIPLLAAEDIYYTKDLTLAAEPEFKFDQSTLKDKFFLKGQPIAQGSVNYNNQSYKVSLISGADYQKKTLPVVGDLLTTDINTINYTYLTLLIITIVIFFSLLVFALIRNVKKKNSINYDKNHLRKKY